MSQVTPCDDNRGKICIIEAGQDRVLLSIFYENDRTNSIFHHWKLDMSTFHGIRPYMCPHLSIARYSFIQPGEQHKQQRLFSKCVDDIHKKILMSAILT